MYLGIGPVLNLRFNLAFSQVLWDPLLNVGVVSNLYYQVTVKNNEFLVDDTTNNTYYPITSMVKRCHEYTANVTAFSAEYHHSISVVHKEEPLLGVCVCVCARACGVCAHTCMRLSPYGESRQAPRDYIIVETVQSLLYLM